MSTEKAPTNLNEDKGKDAQLCVSFFLTPQPRRQGPHDVLTALLCVYCVGLRISRMPPLMRRYPRLWSSPKARSARQCSSGSSSFAQVYPVCSLVGIFSVVLVCSLANNFFLILGYDTGVISGALVTIGGDLGPAELSSGQKVCLTGTVYTEHC